MDLNAGWVSFFQGSNSLQFLTTYSLQFSKQLKKIFSCQRGEENPITLQKHVPVMKITEEAEF